MANKKKQNPVTLWNSEISGDLFVWTEEIEYKKNGKKSTFMRHSTSIGRKDKETGEYDNFYFPVSFSADNAPEEEGRAHCIVSSGFISVYAWVDKEGNKHTRPRLVVTECTWVEE